MTAPWPNRVLPAIVLVAVPGFRMSWGEHSKRGVHPNFVAASELHCDMHTTLPQVDESCRSRPKPAAGVAWRVHQ